MSEEKGAGAEDLGDLWRKRVEGYAELWQSASGKLSEGRYQSDDLLDDWFRWCGMAARDATAVATLLFRLPTDGPRPGQREGAGETDESASGGTAGADEPYEHGSAASGPAGAACDSGVSRADTPTDDPPSADDSEG